MPHLAPPCPSQSLISPCASRRSLLISFLLALSLVRVLARLFSNLVGLCVKPFVGPENADARLVILIYFLSPLCLSLSLSFSIWIFTVPFATTYLPDVIPLGVHFNKLIVSVGVRFRLDFLFCFFNDLYQQMTLRIWNVTNTPHVGWLQCSSTHAYTPLDWDRPFFLFFSSLGMSKLTKCSHGPLLSSPFLTSLPPKMSYVSCRFDHIVVHLCMLSEKLAKRSVASALSEKVWDGRPRPSVLRWAQDFHFEEKKQHQQPTLGLWFLFIILHFLFVHPRIIYQQRIIGTPPFSSTSSRSSSSFQCRVYLLITLWLVCYARRRFRALKWEWCLLIKSIKDSNAS